MKTVNPYLNFNEKCEEAFKFYQSVFGGELRIVRFNDMQDSMGVTGEEANKIANVALPITGNILLMGSDVLESMGHSLTEGNNFYISLEPESSEETERLFSGLSAGGEVEMPLQETEWAESFGSFVDKYGTRWMINYPGKKG